MCVQESCGFGFVLHRRLVAAGAQSFLITPIALNGARKTDKLDARALCLRLSRWLDGNRDELAPIRIPSEAEQRRREVTRRRQFLAREVRCLANRGHGQVAEYCHQALPHRWWGPRQWQKLATLDPWVLGLLTQLRALILALESQVQALLAELATRVQDHSRARSGGCGCGRRHAHGHTRNSGGEGDHVGDDGHAEAGGVAARNRRPASTMSCWIAPNTPASTPTCSRLRQSSPMCVPKRLDILILQCH